MLRAFALYFQLANTAEQHHRMRRRRDVRSTRRGRRASRSTRRSSGSPACPRTSCARRLARRLARARAHRAPDRGDAAHPAAGARPDRRAARRALDDPTLTAARARASSRTQLAEEITILWQTDEVRGERPRVDRRDPARPLVLRGEPVRRGRAAAARRTGGCFPGAPPPFSFGTLDRRRPRRQPGGRRRRRSPAALERARELGARALPRRGARARRSRSRRAARSSASRDELEESIARDERELPPVRGEIAAPERRSSRTAGSSRSCGGGSANDGYAAPEELLADLARDPAQPRGAPRRARSPTGALAALERRVELFGFHLAKLDVRLHAERGARADRAHARGLRRGRGGARARHGPRALDTVIVSATTSADDVLARARPDRRAGLDRPAVRDDRRPRRPRRRRSADAARRRALRARASPSAAAGSR